MKQKLLLHICCGPCAIFPFSYFCRENYDVTLYFYNPNIHPYKEHQKRLEYAKRFAEDMSVKLITEDGYAEFDKILMAFLQAGAEKRCLLCYDWRLQKAAAYAKENNYDAFSTSLLVSPFQKHAAIKNAGDDAADKNGIKFVYEDLRFGWKEAVETAKKREYYRQPYCGCVLSERDRYYKAVVKS